MRLNLTAGPAPRLLAAGTPDWLGTDGQRIVWAARDVCFILDDSGVTTARIPDEVVEVAASAAGITVATACGVVRLDAGGTTLGMITVDEGDPLEVLPGRDCALVVAVPEHSLVSLAGGAAVPIPDAATRARFAAPWATGVGLVWIDLEMLYRLESGKIPNALGRTPDPQALACGPGGAALVALKGDTVCAAPRSLAVRLGRVADVESARFAPDGRRALVADEDGVAEIDLADGKELRRWDGPFSPVGWAPGPVRINRDSGELIHESGSVILGGFTGGTASCAGGLLAGPGGALWNLGDGSRIRGDLGGGVCATDGVKTAVVGPTEARILGAGNGADASFVHGVGGPDDEVDLAQLRGDELIVQAESGAAAAFSLDGALRWRRAAGEAGPAGENGGLDPEAHGVPGVDLGEPGEPSESTVSGVPLPLPADGAARAGSGEVWLWTDEGALIAV